MSTYLVTGGAGFIGSNLVDRLLELNNQVIVIDNFNDYYNPEIKMNNIGNAVRSINYKIYKEDIRNREGLKRIFDENNIDCVIHLAAMAGVRPSLENPITYQEVNIIGTNNLLEEMKNHNINNLVMASSSSVYGNSKIFPLKEDMSVNNPISIYAETKKSNELMTHVYHHIYEMNVIMLRLFTVYGKRQRPDLAINKFINKILNNEEIEMYGNGETFRDYTYIDDIVEGIIKSINYVENNNKVYEVINLGSSNPIKLIDMINVIGNTLNINPLIKKMDMQPGDVYGTYADISKAKKLLGYNPQTSFEDGIREYINSIKANEIGEKSNKI
ncbi:MAG: GDP-mannose 4,6-dehydratase [Bacilli bacterium]|nr:GDP-mannose 4,6-dehydratase [Bacilli bacterium]